MPTQLAITILVILIITGAIAFGILLRNVWLRSIPIRKQYGLQPPIYNRNKPNPLQWLYNRAEEQRHNPCNHLVVTEHAILKWDLEAKRPYITLRISYTNLGLYDLEIGRPEGIAFYNGSQLPDRLHDEGGHNNVGVNVSSHTQFDIYIPKEFAEDVHKEISSPNGELKGLSLQNVNVKVHIVGDTKVFKWSLGGAGNEFFRPMR